MATPIKRTRAVTILALAVLAAGCGRREHAGQAMTGDSGGAMAGMPMRMPGIEMLPAMRAHLDSLTPMAPDAMGARMSAHLDLASRLMDAMGADMRGMGMMPDSAWVALGDSLRRDLADLPGLSGAALGQRMQAHAGRMRRLMARHEGMMRM